MNILFARKLISGGVSNNSPRMIPTTFDHIWPNSIFLAGPTPTQEGVVSWRPDALAYLKQSGFKGTVVVPEDAPGEPNTFIGEGNFTGKEKELSKKAQKRWEWWALAHVACVAFWIPRQMATMPALTTNIETGLLFAFRPNNIVFGAPTKAVKTGYIKQLCEDAVLVHSLFRRRLAEQPILFYNTMEGTLTKAMEMAWSY